MGLSNERCKERMQVICKTYLAIKKRGTAKDIFNFIQNNNFGISNDITYHQVVDYLRNNVYKPHRRDRGYLRNCYDYTQDGQKPRVYYIKE